MLCPCLDSDECELSGGFALARVAGSAYVRDAVALRDPALGRKRPDRCEQLPLWPGVVPEGDERSAHRELIAYLLGDLTLLHAAALRVSEANTLTWGRHVETDNDSVIHVTVTKDISKTHRERRAPVLDDRVAERLMTRQNAATSQAAHVIGPPANAATVWDPRNCSAERAKLYVEMAQALDIELLNTARTHVWRATLNSMLLEEVPEVIRAAAIGPLDVTAHHPPGVAVNWTCRGW
jgi:integrase